MGYDIYIYKSISWHSGVVSFYSGVGFVWVSFFFQNSNLDRCGSRGEWGRA